MPSLIFVTLDDGEYADQWTSEPNTLLHTDEVAGHRMLRWCGQRRGRRDHMVGSGTLVAVRESAKIKAFTIVGRVIEIECIRKQDGSVCGIYDILVELTAAPRVIHRDNGDRYTHWTVLRALGIPTQDAQPQGIYAC
jgi:hypothetical protein